MHSILFSITFCGAFKQFHLSLIQSSDFGFDCILWLWETQKANDILYKLISCAHIIFHHDVSRFLFDIWMVHFGHEEHFWFREWIVIIEVYVHSKSTAGVC